MKIVINAISATAGGARTYLVNLLRTLPDLGAHEYRIYAPSAIQTGMRASSDRLEILERPWAERGYAARFVWEQIALPRAARRWGADVLICVGNFCPMRSAVPIVLLSRNSLYFTPRFLKDLLNRGHYLWAARHLLMMWLALRSAQAARLTITPTQAMADMLRGAACDRTLRLKIIPHGFEPWPHRNGSGSRQPPPPFRFLVVSRYNYFRNFETVFRALALLRNNGVDAQVLLSTSLRPGTQLGGYDVTNASRLVDELGIRSAIVALGEVAYQDLPAAYGMAHAVVCPSYAESFGLTLLEAMALGLPVIASDIAAHREVAGGAALFFPPFDAEALAHRCRSLISNQALQAELQAMGLQRAQKFSWRQHFQELLEAASQAAG